MWLFVFLSYSLHKIVLKKKMLLNFRKSTGLLTSLASLTFVFLFFFLFFFQFHPLILSWLRIEFHNMFYFSFYKVIIILKKIILVLVWRLILQGSIFVIIWLKNSLEKKKLINPNGVHYPVCGFDVLTWVTRFMGLPIKLDMFVF